MPTLRSDFGSVPVPSVRRIVTRTLIGIVAVLVLGTILGSFRNVQEQEVGIRTRFGAIVGDALGPGLHFKTPWIEDIVLMDTTVKKTEVNASAASKDLQSVTAVIAISTQLNRGRSLDVYRNFRKDYDARLVAPAIPEAIKAATAKYTAEELITKRSEVRDAARENLRSKIEQHGISIVDFNIVDFDFSAGFNAAIEAKVTQEQTALAEQNKLKTIEFQAKQKEAAAVGEKNAAIARAQGEAESMAIRGKSLRENPALIELERVNAWKEIGLALAGKWQGNLPTTLLSGSALPFLNLAK